MMVEFTVLIKLSLIHLQLLLLLLFCIRILWFPLPKLYTEKLVLLIQMVKLCSIIETMS